MTVTIHLYFLKNFKQLITSLYSQITVLKRQKSMEGSSNYIYKNRKYYFFIIITIELRSTCDYWYSAALKQDDKLQQVMLSDMLHWHNVQWRSEEADQRLK